MFHVKTIYSSFERNYRGSKSQFREFDFRLEQNDSVLWILSFKTPRSRAIASSCGGGIYVPSGSKLG